MGADKILKEYFDLEDDSFVYSSVAHGVDMNHLHMPLDLVSVEPVHWCHSQEIFLRASKLKPSFKAPHPFLISSKGVTIEPTQNILVIGPPASMENDRRLLKLLIKNNVTKGSILLKYRGDMTDSIEFWREHGFFVETAGSPDKDFYTRLISIFGKYKNIYSGNLSSALFFASSLGCNIEILEEYFYKSYEMPNYLALFDKESLGYRPYVEALRSRDQDRIRSLSLSILGADFFQIRDEQREFFLQIGHELTSNFFFKENISRFSKNFRIFLAFLLKKQVFLTKSLSEIFQSRFNAEVSLCECNDFGFWGGIDEDSYMNITHIHYDDKNNEPGRGAE
jgi:hypothetical protein